LVAIIIGAGACGFGRGGDATPTTASATIDATPDTIEQTVETRWNTESARGVKELLAAYPVALIGQVEAVTFTHKSLAPTGPSGIPAATVTGKPTLAAGVEPGYPTSHYRVRIEQVLAGSESVGDVALVYQWGGDETMPGGATERWILDGDAPLEVGQRYLLFLTQTPDGGGELVAAPWGKFHLTDRPETLDAQWATTGVVADLVSRSTREIAAVIAQAAIR
jgi:hypothetical protein